VAGGVGYLMNQGGWFFTGLDCLTIGFFQSDSFVPYHSGNGTIITDGSYGAKVDWDRRLAALPKRRFQRARRQLHLDVRGDPRLDPAFPK